MQHQLPVKLTLHLTLTHKLELLHFVQYSTCSGQSTIPQLYDDLKIPEPPRLQKAEMEASKLHTLTMPWDSVQGNHTANSHKAQLWQSATPCEIIWHPSDNIGKGPMACWNVPGGTLYFCSTPTRYPGGHSHKPSPCPQSTLVEDWMDKLPQSLWDSCRRPSGWNPPKSEVRQLSSCRILARAFPFLSTGTVNATMRRTHNPQSLLRANLTQRSTLLPQWPSAEKWTSVPIIVSTLVGDKLLQKLLTLSCSREQWRQFADLMFVSCIRRHWSRTRCARCYSRYRCRWSSRWFCCCATRWNGRSRKTR